MTFFQWLDKLFNTEQDTPPSEINAVFPIASDTRGYAKEQRRRAEEAAAREFSAWCRSERNKIYARMADYSSMGSLSCLYYLDMQHRESHGRSSADFYDEIIHELRCKDYIVTEANAGGYAIQISWEVSDDNRTEGSSPTNDGL